MTHEGKARARGNQSGPQPLIKAGRNTALNLREARVYSECGELEGENPRMTGTRLRENGIALAHQLLQEETE